MLPFIIALIIFLATVTYMIIETHLLKTTFHTFKINKKKPRNGKLVFLHFTDLHLGRTGISNQKILNVINQNPSDFLVFTGDYFEEDTQIPKLFELIDSIQKGYTKPIYLCFGNHDNKDVFGRFEGTKEYVTEELTRRNITILENDAATYSDTSSSLRIIGLSDARSNQADVRSIVTQIRSYDPETPNLLITHNSDILIKIDPGSVDFAIAGHTHGAQIRTPFNLETKLLHKKDILSTKQNIIRGYHRYNAIDLYISRGLGCSVFPIRFLSKPEVVVYTID